MSARWPCPRPARARTSSPCSCGPKRRGDRYVLNGTKFWITNAPHADMLVVYAKTDPDAGSQRHHRLPDREGHDGLLVSPRSSTRWACAAATTAELVFEDCEVPEENVMGTRGRRRRRADERPGLRARGARRAGQLGIMQACLDVVLPYVRERKQFGKPIGSFQLMQAKVADMYVALNSARAYVYAVARACDAGQHHALRRGRRDPAGQRECREGRRSRRSRRWAAPATPGNGRSNVWPATPSCTTSAPAPTRSGASLIGRELIGAMP